MIILNDYIEKAINELKEMENIPEISVLANQLKLVIYSAIREAGKSYVRNKTKTTETEYDEECKKPVREVISEKEDIIPMEGNIDTMSLKRLTSALKDVQDILAQTQQSNEDNDEGGVVILAAVDGE